MTTATVSTPRLVSRSGFTVRLMARTLAIVAAIVVVDWTRFARVVRAETMVQLQRDYASAAPLSGVTAGEMAPGDAARTDQEVRDYIRANVSTLYHPTGTCAMGGDSALHAARQASVVDPQLRVRGVTGLRVVDASVMPRLPRGNTNAPTIAIAERASDLIIGRAPLAPDPVGADTTELTVAR